MTFKFKDQLARARTVSQLLKDKQSEIVSLATTINKLEQKENKDQLTTDEEHILNHLWLSVENMLNAFEPLVGIDIDDNDLKTLTQRVKEEQQ